MDRQKEDERASAKKRRLAEQRIRESTDRRWARLNLDSADDSSSDSEDGDVSDGGTPLLLSTTAQGDQGHQRQSNVPFLRLRSSSKRLTIDISSLEANIEQYVDEEVHATEPLTARDLRAKASAKVSSRLTPRSPPPRHNVVGLGRNLRSKAGKSREGLAAASVVVSAADNASASIPRTGTESIPGIDATAATAATAAIATQDDDSLQFQMRMNPLNAPYLRKLCKTDDLALVHSLKLKIDVDEKPIDNLGNTLPNLIELKMNNSQIRSFRDFGTSMRRLQVLWISRCGVQELDGIASLPSLIELYVSFNEIRDLTPLSLHETLQIVDLEGNQVSTVEDVEMLGTCSEMYSLALQDNPVCAVPEFRGIVCRLIPHLQVLDEIPVADANGVVPTISDDALDRARAFCREHQTTMRGDAEEKMFEGDDINVNRWIERSEQHASVSATYTKLKGVKAQLKLDEAGVNKAGDGGHVITAWNSVSMPKANASSDLTHGSSEVLAGNVARGLRRRRANNKAKLEAAEIARALLEEKKKAWEMQNLGGGSGVHRRAGEREGSEARPRMVIEGLDRLAKVGATGSADASGHSTQQSSARTSADGDSCRASSASFVTPRDVLNSRGSVSEDVSLGRSPPQSMSERRFRELERAVRREGGDGGDSSRGALFKQRKGTNEKTVAKRPARADAESVSLQRSSAPFTPLATEGKAKGLSIIEMSDDQFEAVVDDILLTHDLDGELRSLEDSLESWKGQETPEEEGDEERNEKEAEKEKRTRTQKDRRKGIGEQATPTKNELSLPLKLDKEKRRGKKYSKGNKISKFPEETACPATHAQRLSPPSTASSAASTELLHTSRTECERPRSGEMKQRSGWKRRSDDELVEMLRMKPKHVPALRTEDGFRRYFLGIPMDRMKSLLRRAYADLPEKQRRKKSRRRMKLLDVLR